MTDVLHTPHQLVELPDGSRGEFLEGIGVASTCICAKAHSPAPLRYVWHHILPKACGGQATADNLASLCDNCHYGVHAMMSDLKANNGRRSPRFAHFAGTMRELLASKGWLLAVAAGTVDKIPNEGGASE